MNLIIQFLVFLLQLYYIVLLLRVVMTWLPNIDPRNALVRFLYDITEPVLRPIRQMVPPQGGFDLSPMIAFLGIFVLTTILQRLS
ncbi:MAG: YggT family protein [Anaerolineae bacterium]|nr:YggT family protein [Anaerolineae bacterium]MDW8172423.1 YggT family protein [Anaerolineae bacterium]